MTGRLRCDTLATLDSATTDEVVTLALAAADHDGFDALNEAATLALRHTPPGTTHVLARDGDALVGYAQLQTGDTVAGSLVVALDVRRQGVGTALLETLRTLAAGRALQVWAPHDTPGAAALAARHGLTRVRELMIMKRPLADPVPAPATAAGVTIRTFDPHADAASWLRVNARAFAHHPEQGAITASDLAERMAEEWFDAAGFFLAVRDADQTLLGFHWTKEHPDALGEVYVLGVDPDSGGQGLGKALLRTGLRHLADGGDTTVLLYVEADHPSAVGLYASHGFVEASRDVLYATSAGAPERLRSPTS